MGEGIVHGRVWAEVRHGPSTNTIHVHAARALNRHVQPRTCVPDCGQSAARSCAQRAFPPSLSLCLPLLVFPHSLTQSLSLPRQEHFYKTCCRGVYKIHQVKYSSAAGGGHASIIACRFTAYRIHDILGDQQITQVVSVCCEDLMRFSLLLRAFHRSMRLMPFLQRLILPRLRGGHKPGPCRRVQLVLLRSPTAPS